MGRDGPCCAGCGCCFSGQSFFLSEDQPLEPFPEACVCAVAGDCSGTLSPSKIGKVVEQGLAEGCCLWPHGGKHCWQKVKKEMGILTLTSKTDASSLSH